MLLLLRGSLSLVLGTQAAILLVSIAHTGAAHGGHADLPLAVPIVLGGAELVAALLFLVPRTVWPGGALLIAVLAAAAAAQLAVGSPPPPSFVVYAAAIATVMAGARREVRA